MAAMIMPTEAQLEALFKEFDTSGDGFIEFDELKAALAKAGKVVDDDECKKILAEADENSDGMISFSEVLMLEPRITSPAEEQIGVRSHAVCSSKQSSSSRPTCCLPGSSSSRAQGA